ncbi:MAG: hypothetical protein JJ977_18615 [Kordiimonadaceae bacterium]|nr:hypothetical protein [Kordiimonadaceae bacterium]
MLPNREQLVEEFVNAGKALPGFNLASEEIVTDQWLAPHIAKDMMAGYGAVYVFSLPCSSTSEAGPDRVLKVEWRERILIHAFGINITKAVVPKALCPVP